MPGHLTDPSMKTAGQRQQLLPRHGQAAAPGPALILTQLPVHFGLGGSSCGRRRIGITQLPEEERRGGRKLPRIFVLAAARVLLHVAEFPFILIIFRLLHRLLYNSKPPLGADWGVWLLLLRLDPLRLAG